MQKAMLKSNHQNQHTESTHKLECRNLQGKTLPNTSLLCLERDVRPSWPTRSVLFSTGTALAHQAQQLQRARKTSRGWEKMGLIMFDPFDLWVCPGPEVVFQKVREIIETVLLKEKTVIQHNMIICMVCGVGFDRLGGKTTCTLVMLPVCIQLDDPH